MNFYFINEIISCNEGCFFSNIIAQKEFLMDADSMSILYFHVLKGGNLSVLRKPWRI